MSEKRAESRGFMKGLFEGRIDEEALHPYPRMEDEERENVGMLLDSLRRFAEKEIDAAAIDEQRIIPENVKNGLAELGVMGLTIPEEYGGFGMSPTAYCRLMETITRIDGSIATHIGGHLSLGSKGIVLHGTPEQKERFLPKMATGEWIGAYALTEAGSGSDASAMKSRGVFDAGRDGWLLNGSKIWCTNGGYAHVIQTFARTEVELDGKKLDKITAFLVTRDMPGFSSGRPEYKMGIKGSNTVELAFEDVFVPSGNVIGEPGRGYRIALEILDTGRLSLAAGCIGVIREAMTRALEHAEQRRQFGRSVVEFEMLREKFAEMALDVFALESMVYLTAGMIARGDDAAVEAAICKVFGTEAAWRAVNHAVQIAGGTGFMREYPYERLLRDARVNMIFEGTNEVLRMFIALTGMQGPGRRLRTGGGAGAGGIEAAAGRASGREAALPGTMPTGIGGSKAASAGAGGSGQAAQTDAPLAGEREILAARTADLAMTVTAALVEHGRRIMDREYLQHRIADAAIELFALSATLSRTSAAIERSGGEEARRELLLTRTLFAESSERIRRALGAVTAHHDGSWEEIVEEVRKAGDHPAPLP